RIPRTPRRTVLYLPRTRSRIRTQVMPLRKQPTARSPSTKPEPQRAAVTLRLWPSNPSAPTFQPAEDRPGVRGMDPYLNDENLALRREVRQFAEKESAPVARELDEQSRFPWENVR